MGRTVPSYRIATDIEKRKWKPFSEALDKSERKMFDEMMSYSSEWNFQQKPTIYLIRFIKTGSGK